MTETEREREKEERRKKGAKNKTHMYTGPLSRRCSLAV